MPLTYLTMLAFIKKYLLILSAGFLTFIIPIQSFLIITVCLVVADMITGIIKAKFANKEEINSKGLGRTVLKIIVYFCAILAAQGMVAVFGLGEFFTYITAFLIALTEFKSLIENVEAVTDVKIWSIIKNNTPLIKKYFKE